jgi:hypothetical protein
MTILSEMIQEPDILLPKSVFFPEIGEKRAKVYTVTE